MKVKKMYGDMLKEREGMRQGVSGGFWWKNLKILAIEQ